MTYGYVRVSTKEQKEDRQMAALSESGIIFDEIFIDKESGKDFNRSGYKKLYRRLKKGDVIIIKSIDRLGRDYDEILKQWRSITKTKGADIKVLDMPILDTTQNKDTLGTFISDLVLQLLSYVAENERKSIKQRQAEGIAAAKAKGVKFGREKKYNAEEYKDIYQKYKNEGLSVKAATQMMGVSRTTFTRIIKELEAAEEKDLPKTENVNFNP